MTFDEALLAKNEIVDTIIIIIIIIEETTYKVFIIPYDENDFSKYLAV